MAKRGSWSAVYDWMLELDLTASELLIYSRILSFSSSEVGGYIGKVDSLAQWGRCTRRQAHRVLNNLMERGFVKKSYIKTDIGTGIKYTAECDIKSQHCDAMSHQYDTMSHEGVTPCHSECDTESLPTLYNNNIYNNTIIGGGNIDTSVKQPPPPPTVEEIEAYCREIGNGIDAKRFHDYYSLRDWKWREGPITEPEKWQAVVRLWGKDKPKNEDKQDQFYGGSFDTDEFFEAALAKSYGG
jgi:predicted transcriptional regulator